MVSDANNKKNSEDLIQKAISGNETAFGQVYDLYFEKIYRFIYFRVNHKETAEDLVAETFVRVWNKKTEILEAAAFTGWLFQIARNLVIDHYRSRKPTVDLVELENFLEYEDNVIEKLNLKFQQESLLDALEKLSNDQQIVIKLKFIDDLENHEIAKILNKSEGAIRVIQHRATKELKRLIEENRDGK